jgi:cystathionine gamma-synthase
MPLGLPLPPAEEHAISASMPLWSHVVGYEEGDPWIHDQLTLGYPRFVYHPSTRALFDHLEDTLGDGSEAVVAFPSAAAAARCQAFVERSLAGLRAEQPPPDPPHASRLLPVLPGGTGQMELTAVAVPCEHEALLKAYWQHTGELISSRAAAATLAQLELELELGLGLELELEQEPVGGGGAVELAGTATAGELQEVLAALAGGAPAALAEDVYLFQSGMAAVYNAHRLASNLDRQVCSPYSSPLPLCPSAVRANTQRRGLRRRARQRRDPVAVPAALTEPTGTFGASAVFGFSYLDTLKLLRFARPAIMQLRRPLSSTAQPLPLPAPRRSLEPTVPCRAEQFSGGAEFYSRGGRAELAALADSLAASARLGSGQLQAIFCEHPTNPLLDTPPLEELAALARAHRIPLVRPLCHR